MRDNSSGALEAEVAAEKLHVCVRPAPAQAVGVGPGSARVWQAQVVGAAPAAVGLRFSRDTRDSRVKGATHLRPAFFSAASLAARALLALA